MVNPVPPSRAGSLPLVGGSLALDFANTQSGLGTQQHIDRLRAPERVAVWIEHAGRLSKTAAAGLRARRSPAQAAALFENARRRGA